MTPIDYSFLLEIISTLGFCDSHSSDTAPTSLPFPFISFGGSSLKYWYPRAAVTSQWSVGSERLTTTALEGLDSIHSSLFPQPPRKTPIIPATSVTSHTYRGFTNIHLQFLPFTLATGVYINQHPGLPKDLKFSVSEKWFSFSFQTPQNWFATSVLPQFQWLYHNQPSHKSLVPHLYYSYV